MISSLRTSRLSGNNLTRGSADAVNGESVYGTLLKDVNDRWTVQPLVFPFVMDIPAMSKKINYVIRNRQGNIGTQVGVAVTIPTCVLEGGR